MQAGRSGCEILRVDPRAEPEVLAAAHRRPARKRHSAEPAVVSSRSHGVGCARIHYLLVNSRGWQGALSFRKK